MDFEETEDYVEDADDICSDVKVPIAHQAAAAGDIITVTNVIKEDPTVLEQPDADGMTLLCHAVAGGQLDTVKLLQKMGGNINIQDAAGRTPLAIAAYMGWYEGIVLLLRKGARQDISDKSGRLPLHAATYQSETRSMAILLQNLSEEEVNQPDNEGMTTLHWAAFHNRPDVVQLLLMRGADITAMDIDGKTALHWAAQNGSTACCNVILGATGGAHLVNTIDNTGKTCVHLASAAGHCSTLKELATLKYTNLEALDPDDRTPLHWAAASGQAKCVALLLKLNVCPTPIDADGGTPLDYAIQGCHQECLDLLEAADRVSEVEVDVESAAKTIELQHTISPARKKRFGFLTNFFSRRSPKTKRCLGTAEDEASSETVAASDSFYRLQFAPEMSSGGDSAVSEEARSDATIEKDDMSGGDLNSGISQAAAMEETSDRQGFEVEEITAQMKSDLVISVAGKTNAKRNSLTRRSIDAQGLPLMRTDIDPNMRFSLPPEEGGMAMKVAGDFMGVPPGVDVGNGSSRLAKLSTKLAPIQTNSFLAIAEDNKPVEDVEIPLQRYSRLPSPPAMKKEEDLEDQSRLSAGSKDSLDISSFPTLPLRNVPSPYGRLDPIPAQRVESFTSTRMDRPKHEVLTRKRSRSHSNVLEQQRGTNSSGAEFDPLLASIARANAVSGPPSPVHATPAPLGPLKGHKPKRTGSVATLPPPAKGQQTVPRSEMKKLTQSWEHLLNPVQMVNKPRSQSLKTQGEFERHAVIPRSISHEPGMDWGETALSSGKTKKGRKKSKKLQKRPVDTRDIQEHGEESSARGHSIFPPILPGPPALFNVQNRVSPRRSRRPSTGDIEEVTNPQACTIDSEGRGKKKKKKKKESSDVYVEVCSYKGHWNDDDEDDAGASGSSGGSGRAERRAHAQAVGTMCERGPQFSGETPSGQMGTSSNTVAMHDGNVTGSDDIEVVGLVTTQSLQRFQFNALRTHQGQGCLVRAHPKLVRTRSPSAK